MRASMSGVPFGQGPPTAAPAFVRPRNGGPTRFWAQRTCAAAAIVNFGRRDQLLGGIT